MNRGLEGASNVAKEMPLHGRLQTQAACSGSYHAAENTHVNPNTFRDREDTLGKKFGKIFFL